MDTVKSGFVDFIPAGEEEGSPYGKGGYLDFVPAVEPKPQVIKEAPEAPEEETPPIDVVTSEETVVVEPEVELLETSDEAKTKGKK